MYDLSYWKWEKFELLKYIPLQQLYFISGCGIINTTSKLLGGNFTKGPNIEECRKICNSYIEPIQYNLNYMSMSNATCYCFYKTDINLTQCHNQLSSCGKEAFCHEDINVTYGSTIPIYRTNSKYVYWIKEFVHSQFNTFQAFN